MISRKAVIANKQGIHVRPSKVIAAAAAGYPGSIVVRKGSYEIDTLNTMNLLTLALLEHDRITVEVRGPDEQAMLDRLIELFETHFDFPAKT